MLLNISYRVPAMWWGWLPSSSSCTAFFIHCLIIIIIYLFPALCLLRPSPPIYGPAGGNQCCPTAPSASFLPSGLILMSFSARGKSEHCASCCMRASASTSATMASTIGT